VSFVSNVLQTSTKNVKGVFVCTVKLMAKLDKKASYNEFSEVNGVQCIGGFEIKHIWHSPVTGWTWYATEVTTKNKVPSTYYGFVKGFENEWGSWYASDMEVSDIEEVPKERWVNTIPQ
jgi:hypothetical protein